jgi:methanogenic corrinoid protein MtbC1
MVQAIKTQIIPKIALVLGSAPKPVEQTPAAPDTVPEFAALILGNDDLAAATHVNRLLASGAVVETVFLDLLAPTARYLGEMWEADTTDFSNVTLGVSRLQRIMRQLGEHFCEQAYPVVTGESALLTILPGEQHSFGVSMVAEFFRRAGWSLHTGPFSSHQELTSLVQERWFDVVGFSVTSDRRLDELKRGIHDIRRDSRNRNVGIMLGGPMMITRPELATDLHADIVCVDAVSAPRQASDLIDRLKQRV